MNNSTLRGRLRALSFCLFAVFLIGCGTGGGPITNCDPASFTPNYVTKLNHLLAWPDIPIKIFFVKDGEFSAARRLVALQGFDQWVDATGGTLTYSEVASATGADVTVRFDPTTANGLTTMHFTGLEMTLAEVEIGVKNQLPGDLQCVAAHEFGHALGIDGHSDDSNDLMYFEHVIGELCPVTTRDLNTMKTGYCHLFGRSARLPDHGRGGTPEVVRIR